MENSYLYFFSAVPQCISALIALIGAFHIFRNQATNDSLFGFSKNVYDIAIEIPILGNLINDLKQAMIAKKLEEIDGIFNEIQGRVNQRKDNLQQLFNQPNQQNKWINPELKQIEKILMTISHYKDVKSLRVSRNAKFKIVLTFSMIIVIYTLAAITLEPILTTHKNCYIAIILFVLTVLLVIYNLIQLREYIFLSN